jgi:hypothetical protein
MITVKYRYVFTKSYTLISRQNKMSNLSEKRSVYANYLTVTVSLINISIFKYYYKV